MSCNPFCLSLRTPDCVTRPRMRKDLLISVANPSTMLPPTRAASTMSELRRKAREATMAMSSSYQSGTLRASAMKCLSDSGASTGRSCGSCNALASKGWTSFGGSKARSADTASASGSPMVV